MCSAVELKTYIKEALDFIKENLPDEEIFVGFSGGRDCPQKSFMV
jgi:tRNA(Ile)-lysidine synthase TilS/MesJ